MGTCQARCPEPEPVTKRLRLSGVGLHSLESSTERSIFGAAHPLVLPERGVEAAGFGHVSVLRELDKPPARKQQHKSNMLLNSGASISTDGSSTSQVVDASGSRSVCRVCGAASCKIMALRRDPAIVDQSQAAARLTHVVPPQHRKRLKTTLSSDMPASLGLHDDRSAEVLDESHPVTHLAHVAPPQHRKSLKRSLGSDTPSSTGPQNSGSADVVDESRPATFLTNAAPPRHRKSLKSSLGSDRPPSLGQKDDRGTACPVKSSQSPRCALQAKMELCVDRPACDGVEEWQSFLGRASQRVAHLQDTPGKLFEVFRTTDDLGLAYACFCRLFHLATAEEGTSSTLLVPWMMPFGSSCSSWRFPYEPIRKLLGSNWKAKQLWEKMDKRAGRPEYASRPCSAGRFKGRRVVVVGAGPCGLRAAIELKLLGARVTIVERRQSFSRLNQLHLWPWCAEDIKELGAKVLEPPPQDFGANPDLLHIGIAELQALLFKTSLLLGAEVLLGVDFCSLTVDGLQGWRAHLSHSSSQIPGGEVSPRAPEVLDGVIALMCADGQGCSAGRILGVGVSELSSLRAEDAIGLVCNFAPLAEGADRELRSFSLARQFYGSLFAELAGSTGAELENIVYTKSRASHYFVMTPTRRCLLQAGVLRDGACRPLLSKDNVDRTALDALVRRVAAFRFKADQPTLPQLHPGPSLTYADSGPMLFDFSKLRRASDGLHFLDPFSPSHRGQNLASHTGCATPLLLAVVGDALLEPFWPEGLGVVRGFLGVLDASAAAAAWASGSETEQVRADFAAAFAQLKTLGAATRRSVLRDDERQYALAPSSRYRGVQPRIGGLPV